MHRTARSVHRGIGEGNVQPGSRVLADALGYFKERVPRQNGDIHRMPRRADANASVRCGQLVIKRAGCTEDAGLDPQLHRHPSRVIRKARVSIPRIHHAQRFSGERVEGKIGEDGVCRIHV